MTHVITSNDTSINIKYIDEEETHYHLNIPNNDINKKLIENTVFKFDKSGTQTIIMHDDNNVFHLSKMECKYSEFIEMKKQLENTEKEVILLKQELSKNEKELINFKNDLIQQMKNEMVQIKNELSGTNKLLIKEIEKVNDKSVEVSKDMEQLNNNLQQQINITSYYLPVVFYNEDSKHQYYGDKPYTYQLQYILSEHQMKLFCATKIRITNHYRRGPSHNNKYTIFIPQKKTVMLFKEGNVHQGI